MPYGEGVGGDRVVVGRGEVPEGAAGLQTDEVAEGLECGIGLENYQDIKESDVIEAFEIEEAKQKLV